MAQQYAFYPYGNTSSATFTAGVTMSIGGSVTGLPATALRIYNGSAAPVFAAFGTASTITTGVTSGLPVNAIAGIAPVFRTGGASWVVFAGAATHTVYITPGEGID